MNIHPMNFTAHCVVFGFTSIFFFQGWGDKISTMIADTKHKRDKPMADKLIYIPNDIGQYYPFSRLQFLHWLKRLNTQLNEPNNKNSMKVPKLLSQQKKKTLSLNFGNLCNKQPNVPSLSGELHCYPKFYN